VSNFEIACVVSSTGWVLGLVGLVLLWYIAENATPSRWSRKLRIVMYAGVLLALSGFGACSAEDRICEAAERQATN
jgi:hypothetical protein